MKKYDSAVQPQDFNLSSISKSNSDTISTNPENSVLKGEETFSRTGSSYGAYFNVVCVVAGAGTLGIPYALKQGGWISVLFLALSALISIYTGKLLMECLYAKPGERLLSYPEIGEASFGKIGRFVVQLFHYSTLLGVSCLLIMLVGINLDSVANTYEMRELTLQNWIAISGAVIVIPYLSLKTLKEVAWLSAFGALATGLVIGVAVVVGLLDLPNQVNNTHDVVNWKEIPLSLATIGFSFGGNVVYPHIEASMAKPKQWTKVLTFSMFTIFGMYGLIGIVDYYVYGNSVLSPITESLPRGIARVISQLAITLHIVMVIPIALCSFSLEVEKKFNVDRVHMSAIQEFLCRAAIRLTSLIGLTLIAVFVPDFPLFMSLIGAFSNCAVVFFIPIVCHLKLFGWKNRPIWEYIWILIVFVVAFVGCVLGTVGAIQALVERFSQ